MTNLLVFGKVGTEAEAGLPPSCQSNLTSDPAMSPHVSITTPPPPSQVLAFSPFAIENSTSPDKGLSEQNPSAHVSITTPPRPSQIEDGSCFSALAIYPSLPHKETLSSEPISSVHVFVPQSW